MAKILSSAGKDLPSKLDLFDMAIKEISPVENNFPLICFVHTPKCFGTTVLNTLSSAAKNIRHLEEDERFFLKNFKPDDFNKLDWISGHCSIGIFMDLLKWTSREVKYFATVRNPIDHVASLVNYYYFQLKKGYKFIEQEDKNSVGRELINIDKSPESIAKHLINFPHKYFNIQAKYILGDEYNKICQKNEYIHQYISKYSFIASENNLLDLYDRFGFNIKMKNEIYNANQSYEIDKKFFESELVRSVINSYSWADIKLYEQINNFSFKPFQGERRKVSELFLPSLENFDEEKYLRANPDVRNAVIEKIIESGREHFMKFGMHEKRKQYK